MSLSLHDLTADKPAVSAKANAKKGGVPFFGEKDKAKEKEKEDREFLKQMSKPLTKEATAYAMEKMGDVTKVASPKYSEADLAKMYWDIQAYKRAFKDRVTFSTRVTRESPGDVMKKELESITSQLNMRNGEVVMKRMWNSAGTLLGMALASYNPTPYDVTGFNREWHNSMSAGFFDDEITELSIKWSNWISQGPEIRALMKIVEVMRICDARNRGARARASFSMDSDVPQEVINNPAFADL